MSPILIAAGIGFAAAVFLMVWNLVPQPTVSGVLEQRLGAVDDPMSLSFDLDKAELQRPIMERIIQPLLGSLGGFMAKRTKDAQLHQIRLMVSQAGSKQKPETLLALRIMLPVLALGLGFGFTKLLALGPPLTYVMPAGLAILGYFYPTSSLKGRIKKRKKELRVALPGVLDLLTISMEAGLSLDMAIMRVTDSDESILGQEFQKVLNEVRLGRPRGDALLSMAERNDVEELTGFVRSVVQAEPLGVSITNVLRIQSEEMRRFRKQRAEEAGHRAPVMMLLPMMGCIFPCVFLILLGPAVVTIISGSH